MSFDRVAGFITSAVGSRWLFSIVALSLATWWIIGIMTGFPSSWYQFMSALLHTLVFLMTLIIQHSANRRDERMLKEIDAIYDRVRKENGFIDVDSDA